MQDSKNKLIDRLRCHDNVILSWGTGETIAFALCYKKDGALHLFFVLLKRLDPEAQPCRNLLHLPRLGSTRASWPLRSPVAWPHATCLGVCHSECNLLHIFMLIRKFFAKQIDGSRPRYLKVPIIPVLTIFFLLWTLKAWHVRSLVSTIFVVQREML